MFGELLLLQNFSFVTALSEIKFIFNARAVIRHISYVVELENLEQDEYFFANQLFLPFQDDYYNIKPMLNFLVC